MEIIFSEITVIICLAAALLVVCKFLKQPAILAYIVTGIIVGPLGLLKLHNQDFLQVLSEFGITLLLFMLGLEIRIKDFLSIGKMALIIGASQIIFSIVIFFLLSLFLGFVPLTALYLSLALMDSSIIVVLKLMSDKKDLHSLYGKISVGILLIQDFAAIIVLIFLSVFNPKTAATLSLMQFGEVMIKGVLLFGSFWYLSKNFLPKFVEKLSRSSETLFLVSIAWVFGVSFLVASPVIGFTVEIGGFLAGLSLANSMANYQIIAKVKVLRDFFIVLFFVLIGIKMSFTNLAIIIPAIIFSIAVLTVKPLVVISVMGLLGFRKRTSFLTGISLAQISEFSLIVAYLGNKIGHLSDDIVSLVTLVGIITFAVSTYMIVNGNKLYILLGEYLKVFERKNTIQQEPVESSEDFDKLKDHVVLIGGDQMGESILEVLEDLGRSVVVIDFDPTIVRRLKSKSVKIIYGDISDLDIQEKVRIDTAGLVISTIPDIEDNLLLLKKQRKENRRAKIVVMALDSNDAKTLYREGADYVILPHLAGGRQIAKILKDNQLEEIFKLRTLDMAYLA